MFLFYFTSPKISEQSMEHYWRRTNRKIQVRKPLVNSLIANLPSAVALTSIHINATQYKSLIKCCVRKFSLDFLQ